jgi:hypothetical protein
MSSAARVARRRFFCNILPNQHPCTWCLCVVVHLGDVALGPDLAHEEGTNSP